jgi:hypothetical protein
MVFVWVSLGAILMDLYTEPLQLFQLAPQFGVLHTFQASRSLLKSLDVVLRETSFHLFKELFKHFSLPETEVIQSP